MSPEFQRRKGQQTVRQRLLVLMVGLMTFGLIVTGVVSFAVQFDSLRDRIDADLRQEVEEMQQIAVNGPMGDGQPYEDVARLFESFLLSAVTNENEALLALIEDSPMIKSGGTRAFDVGDEDVLAAVQALELEPGRATTFSLRTQGTELRVLAADVALMGDERSGTFVVAIDLGRQRAEIMRQALSFGVISLITLALAALLGWLLLGRLLRPLQELRRATAEISTDNLARRVEVADADDDVAELAVRFNSMLARLEAGVKEQRQFLDDAAHELRTPLTIIRGNVELLDAHSPEDVESTRSLLLDEADRMQRLVDDLLMLARSQRPDFLRRATLDVTELAVESMDRVTALGERAWRLQADAEGEIVADRQRILQAVVQLAANAVKFSEPGSIIEVATRWVDHTTREGVRARRAGAEQSVRYLAVSVRDEGRGIPEEQLPSIFARFARAENVEAVEGSGLGLAIVEAIAHTHGGAVVVDSVEGEGSTFTIWLPDDADLGL